MSFWPKSWGCYPPEYNREIHGPYNPSMYYGKRDTPFGEVKFGELGAWLARRNKSPQAMVQAISRAWFRYRLTWMEVKRPGPYFLYQLLGTAMLLNFWIDRHRIRRERWYRYH